MIYIDVADSISGEIQKRFYQEIFYLYAKYQELLASAASKACVIAENLEAVKKRFSNDLDVSKLSKSWLF